MNEAAASAVLDNRQQSKIDSNSGPPDTSTVGQSAETSKTTEALVTVKQEDDDKKPAEAVIKMELEEAVAPSLAVTSEGNMADKVDDKTGCGDLVTSTVDDDACKKKQEPAAVIPPVKFEFLDEIANFHVSASRKAKERKLLVSNIGPNRRALCARRDLAIRRALCKVNKVCANKRIRFYFYSSCSGGVRMQFRHRIVRGDKRRLAKQGHAAIKAHSN